MRGKGGGAASGGGLNGAIRGFWQPYWMIQTLWYRERAVPFGVCSHTASRLKHKLIQLWQSARRSKYSPGTWIDDVYLEGMKPRQRRIEEQSSVCEGRTNHRGGSSALSSPGLCPDHERGY